MRCGGGCVVPEVKGLMITAVSDVVDICICEVSVFWCF